MNDIDKLLIKLEPEIEKKCDEIKQEKEKKKLYSFLLVCLPMLACITFFFNLNILYLAIGIIILLNAVLFLKLPALLDKNEQGVFYESIH